MIDEIEKGRMIEMKNWYHKWKKWNSKIGKSNDEFEKDIIIESKSEV